MKNYILREGSKFVMETETQRGRIVGSYLADQSMIFEEKELVEVDCVERKLHFHVGDRHYFINNTDVKVIS